MALTDPSTLLSHVVVEGSPGIESYSVPVHGTTSINSVVFPCLPPLKDGQHSSVDDTNIGEINQIKMQKRRMET
jgi:hypothetical protein